jgi:hypothetical protein
MSKLRVYYCHVCGKEVRSTDDRIRHECTAGGFIDMSFKKIEEIVEANKAGQGPRITGHIVEV